MANPQKEEGYTPISNELIEALCRYRIPGQQMQLVWVILRHTWGWGKKKDRISLSQFSKLTGIPSHKCHALLKSLILKKLIIKSTPQKGSSMHVIYSFQKNYEQWQLLPKKGVLPKRAIKVLPKKGVTKERKESIYSEKFFQFISHWNSKKNLRTLQEKETQEKKDTNREFKKALKDYSLEDVIEAIDNYHTVLSNKNEFYFDYRWAPSLFLKRGLKNFLSVNTPFHNFRKKNMKYEKPDPAEQTRKEMKQQ